MNTMEKLCRALVKVGLDEFKPVDLTGNRRGIMVKHDYSGLYPTRETFEKCEQARKIASKFGCRSEQRGYRTATLIYLPSEQNSEAA